MKIPPHTPHIKIGQSLMKELGTPLVADAAVVIFSNFATPFSIGM